MRQSTSKHREHLEPTNHANPHNSPLNVERLVMLLHMLRNDHSASSSSGKKRSASFSNHGSYKRAKVSPSPRQSDHLRNPDDASELEDPTPPVFRHVSEIDYVVSIPDDRRHIHNENAARFGITNHSAEKRLALLLSETPTIDLGKVYFRQLQNRLVALSLVLSGNTYFIEPDQWLLLVPSLDEDIDVDALGFGDCVEDILTTSYILTTGSKATIDAHLQLVAPPGAYDEKNLEVSFQLRLDITVSLVLPTLVRPTNVETKRKRTELEDAQRRFLDFLFPAMSSNPASFEGETNIPFFYSVLGPAPRLPSKLAEEAMQPRLLRPNLLPFQRRSVGWLLGREGKTVTSSGEIVAKPACNASNYSLPLFWDKIVLGNKTWYMNRLDGTVSGDLPPDNCAMGGILAEEPGLGKTLMCISLILLNPAPGRNPSNMCWDPTARLDVKEIKVRQNLLDSEAYLTN
jgi:E3 ubiquitin-protein ligase SHPRH